MSATQIITTTLFRLGVARILNTAWGEHRLTVLTYHRITDATAPDFPYYRPNVSASSAMFERQMQYLSRHFNVVDLASVHDCLLHGHALPPRPLLITFDDGYLDNYTHAFPILQAYGLPAVMFLVPERIDAPTPPWWDECAYYCYHTPLQRATLPLLGAQSLATRQQRRTVAEMLIQRLKYTHETAKHQFLQTLSATLAVPFPAHEAGLFVSWDHVRELVAHGIACQSHTLNHPILTQISLAEAQHQLVESRRRIEHETGVVVTSFAYPNGTRHDFNPSVVQMVRDAGYKLAFTTVPGPMRLATAQRQPLEIRRVYLGYRDTFEMFGLKVMGAAQLAALVRKR